MRKRKIHWKTIIAAIVAAAGLVLMLLMYVRLNELTNQLVYMQDTTNIILSDVGGMQSNIEKTLKEEASMVESYSMEITDMNFAGKNYEVNVSVIPKEYSENTKVSVYFGTLECPLKLEGYAYTGSIKLPLGKSFDGNVTFLLANGKKKSTEVLENYEGLDISLGTVLSGKLEYAPTYKDGAIYLQSGCQFSLDGGKQFQFDSLELVASLDEEEIWSQDLLVDIAENLGESTENTHNPEMGQQVEQENTQGLSVENLLPVNSYSSEMKCYFSYSLIPRREENEPEDVNSLEGEAVQEPDTDISRENHHIRLFLRALSEDGYRFEYDVFQGDYLGAEQEMDEDSFDWTSHSVAYDRKGNVLQLD